MLPLLLCLLPTAQAPQLPPPSGPAHLVEVEGGLRALAQLERLGADVVERGVASGGLKVLADDGQLAALRGRGLRATVVIEDLAAFYAQRLATAASPSSGPGLGAWLQPAFGQGEIGGYYSWDQVGSVLDQIHAAYPSIVGPRTSIGTSLEGRDLWSVKLSDNPGADEAEPEVRIDAMHHAREPEGMQVALWYLLWLCESYGSDPLATYLVDERETWFIPVVNPDGYVHNQQLQPGGGALWRKNRRDNGDGTFGVDLNRNYPFQWGFDNAGSSANTGSETYRGPAAQSEPEVQAMVAFLASRDFRTSLSLHTYSNLWLAPWGYTPAYPPNWAPFDEIGTLATEFNGYPHDPASILLYAANGVTVDHDHGVHGTVSWTPEIGSSSDGFWPPQDRIIPLAEENRIALARTALAAGSWLRVASETLVELGDGDGSYEGGEGLRVELTVRNSGLDAAGAAGVALATTSPWALVTTTPTTLAGLAPFTDAAVTQELQLLDGVPPGAVIPYTVTLSVDGHAFTFESSVVAGAGAPIASFDFEAAGDEGWTVSGPNDASTGLWERGDPVGTAAQPEDDHTPAGSQCWFTGQGAPGGSLGANDVDGGTTTLTSPVLDLSGRAAATLSFWLWYSNDAGAAPGQDVFVVEGSDDGGATWTPLLTVGPTGSGTSGGWLEYELALEDGLALTSTVQVRFQASDLGSGSIVEAALDDVAVRAGLDGEGLGSRLCSPAAANSTGGGAEVYATGSAVVAGQDLTLAAVGLPAGQFGYFVCSQTQGSVTPPGSMGVLCLAGSIGRFRSQLQNSGSDGHMAIAVDLAQLPVTPPVAAVPGETWTFQLWYRDQVGGPTSNFSDAVAVTFE
jgi:hypothetical protein